MASLDHKVLIITGGTQGIGEATARLAASSGAAGIVICGRQQEKGSAVETALKASGCEAAYVPADLSNVEDCRRVVSECDERFGRVDGLVNAAADTNRSRLEETTVEFWDYLFAVNVRAPFVLTQECVRIMRRKQTEGGIVNVLSVAGYCGPPILSAYSSTKGALATFTTNCSNALRDERIRVNGIMLGWTDTPGEHTVQQKTGLPENWLEIAEKAMPFGRLIKPIDVARLTVYLLSDESGIMTGSLIDYAQRTTAYVPPIHVDW